MANNREIEKLQIILNAYNTLWKLPKEEIDNMLNQQIEYYKLYETYQKQPGHEGEFWGVLIDDDDIKVRYCIACKLYFPVMSPREGMVAPFCHKPIKPGETIGCFDRWRWGMNMTVLEYRGV